MKLFHDFGIRALLAVMATIIYGTGLLITVIQGNLEATKLFAAILGPPWLSILTWYFNTRAMQGGSHGA